MSDWSWFDFVDLAQFSSRPFGDANLAASQVAPPIDASSFGASPNDSSATHLILVVHGVGCQDTCPRGLLTLEQAVIALKRRIDAASAEFGSNIAVRAVEWHSRVHRVHGWEREISRVSLPTIPDLRHSIKDVLGDCFLLLSHRWHDVLLAEVAFLLNDAYGSFASRFPAFTGSVSIVAHSLGCSIVWELLSATDSSSPSRMRWPLQFSVANTFMIGSSLGGYLTLISNPNRIMRTARCVNIFHPLDPLAQRLEPWICPEIWSESVAANIPGKSEFPLQTVPPPVSASAFLERTANGVSGRILSRLKLKVSDLEQETSKAITDFSQAINSKWSDVRKEVQKKKLHVKSVIAKVTGQSEHLIANEAQPSDSATPREEEAGHQSVTSDFDTAHSDSDSDAQSSSGSVSKGKLSPCCRIDFELDSTVLEGISETIGIIRSHFCYWDNRSVASLIVTLMHSPCPLSSDVEFGRLDLSAQ